MFKTESDLVEKSIPKLKQVFAGDDFRYVLEAEGLFGIPDLVLFNGRVIAIEYKLSNWKRALVQAYRYRSFAEESYVFLDKSYIHRAKKNIEDFKLSNIGLSSVDIDGNIEIIFQPESRAPYTKSLNDKVLSLLTSSN